jgi:hypothetical protein
LVSYCVMTDIKLLLYNTISECSIVSLTTSFHILTQRFVESCSVQSPPQSLCVCDFLENSTLIGQPLPQEMIKLQSIACQS